MIAHKKKYLTDHYDHYFNLNKTMMVVKNFSLSQTTSVWVHNTETDLWECDDVYD